MYGESLLELVHGRRRFTLGFVVCELSRAFLHSLSVGGADSVITRTYQLTSIARKFDEMAFRILARRLSAIGRAASEPRDVGCRGFANAPLKFKDDGDVDVKRRPTQPSSPQYAVPFYDMFPLGRGASLLGLRDIVDDVLGNVSKLEGQSLRSNSRAPWDVMEDVKAFKLRLDMPGLSKEDVKVDVEEGNLFIKGEKKAGAEDDWARRSTGTYNIKIKLPDNVRVEAIKAELKDGVLRITAPKVEETKKKVAVSVD